ncbi:MAG: hypothetical protein IJH37_00865 [Clostridia bacterium]|nr:hypothetical protein [Clostridia bacterium]
MSKKIILAIAAAATVVTTIAGLYFFESAAAQTYLISASTAPRGTLEFNSETEIVTGISGMKLTVGADTYRVKSAKITYNGIAYIGYMNGANNPNISAGTGTYYRFTFDDTVEDGTLEVMYKLGDNKALHITEDGNELEGYPFSIAGGVTQSSTFNVSAGHSYLIYADGSKLGFYGCSYKVTNKQKDFEEEIQRLTFDLIKGNNADAEHVDCDLAPIQAYESQFGSCDVLWTSSNEDIINNGGAVSAATAETKIEFTGKFSAREDDSLVQYKTFKLTVLCDTEDGAAVAAAADALTLGDTTYVKKDISLPERGRRSTNIKWITSDESVITSNGVVTRAPGEDKTATLTAVITRGEASFTKKFKVTVAGFVPLVLDSFSFEDKNGDIKFSPVDGGILKYIYITSGIKDLSGTEKIIVSVYDSSGNEKGSESLDISADHYDLSSKFDVGIAMDKNDRFKIELKDGDMLLHSIDQPDLTPRVGAKIYVIGDSTASVYEDNNYPRKGWAQLLGNYFNSGEVDVIDLALPGRSSLSFRRETKFSTFKNGIKEGDYLMIQFGHNDSKAEDAARYTDAAGDRFTDGSFKNSMLEYIEIARDKGAYPILVTSISRRQTSDASLERYVKAAKELGDEVGVPVIDLYARTNGYINNVGTEAAKDMFNYVKIRDSRFYNHSGFASSGFFSAGTTDNTHINIYGADIIAEWATEEMISLCIPLSDRVNDYKAVFPLPSYAAAETMDVNAEFYPDDFPWNVKITADYDDNGILTHVKAETVASVGDEKNTKNHRVFYRNSLDDMKPVK